MFFPMLLISCASGPKEVLLQTGEQGFVTSCDANYLEECYSQAGKICQLKGFNIFEKSVDDGDAKITIGCRN